MFLSLYISLPIYQAWHSFLTCDHPALLHDLPGEDLVERQQVLTLLLLLAQVVLVTAAHLFRGVN